ncbi:hypothetical protein [Butyrivibrio proteoclasticus]|uniref:hypothetical protein n=1 Tax=Butyrivibrio proteoclasticus TaxID=43305 RepID=UPI00047E7CCA|nr:hypothetical protein [Butyrivibrio proteoclasticus]
MSTIDIDALFAESELTQDSLQGLISEYWKYDLKQLEAFGNTILSGAFRGGEQRFIVYFVNNKSYWDSSITDAEFDYSQMISVGIDKEEDDLSDLIYEAIEFFLFVSKKTGAEILIKSEIHNDICHVQSGKTIWDPHFYDMYHDYIERNKRN